MITQKTLRGNRTPKSYILSGVRSSDGKRLDQDLNRNLGAEIAKLSREKSELQQGLGGGNTMATYKLKRFSIQPKHKTYTIKRKTFGAVGDVVNNTVNTAANVGKNVAGTGLEVAGGTVEKTAKVAKPVAGLAGGIAGALPGAATGAAIGSVIPVVGTAIGALAGGMLGAKGGSELGKGAVGIAEGVGRSIKEGGQDLKGA
jgi:hypothetical protein